jgi:hypothetical protein
MPADPSNAVMRCDWRHSSSRTQPCDRPRPSSRSDDIELIVIALVVDQLDATRDP